eukprot:Platyproteum_vivax@DN4691_c0_g1_i1.p1
MKAVKDPSLVGSKEKNRIVGAKNPKKQSSEVVVWTLLHAVFFSLVVVFVVLKLVWGLSYVKYSRKVPYENASVDMMEDGNTLYAHGLTEGYSDILSSVNCKLDAVNGPCYPGRFFLKAHIFHSPYGIVYFLMMLPSVLTYYFSSKTEQDVIRWRMEFNLGLFGWRAIVLYYIPNLIIPFDFSDHAVLLTMMFSVLTFELVFLQHTSKSVIQKATIYYCWLALSIVLYSTFFTVIYYHTTLEILTGFLVGITGICIPSFFIMQKLGVPPKGKSG